MPGRSSHKTPFEVMGRREPGQETASSGEPVRSAPERPERPASVDVEDRVDLLTPGEPLVLRVPKGLAAAALVVLVVLLGLAYWVGYERGAGHTERAEAAEAQEGSAAGGPPAPLRAAPAFVGADLAGPGVAVLDAGRSPLGVYEAGSASDPRVDGMNYLILATYPGPEARRLAEFLVTQRVASVLNPVNNDRFQVIAVNAGFSRDAFERGSQEAYRQAMLEVGRAWHAHNGRRGQDALQDMYFYRHGPSP